MSTGLLTSAAKPFASQFRVGEGRGCGLAVGAAVDSGVGLAVGSALGEDVTGVGPIEAAIAVGDTKATGLVD
jgi:hypothetical protein